MMDIHPVIYKWLDLASRTTQEDVRNRCYDRAYWWIKYTGLRWEYFV